MKGGAFEWDLAVRFKILSVAMCLFDGGRIGISFDTQNFVVALDGCHLQRQFSINSWIVSFIDVGKHLVVVVCNPSLGSVNSVCGNPVVLFLFGIRNEIEKSNGGGACTSHIHEA